MSFWIPPGGDYEQVLVLSQWFRFDFVGEYFLAAQLDTTIAVADGNSYQTPLISLGHAPMANSLLRGQEKRMMREREVQIGNPGLKR